VVIPVERHVSLTVEGKDLNGNDVRLELEELPARIVQHELDHLDGVLILDRTTAEARREALGTLRPQSVLVRE
jgi:peptide deformylase